MRTYFDASVVVALFTHDTFSQRADEFMRSDTVVPVVSDFGAAEFSSAVARRVRMGEISADRARAILSLFDHWKGEIAGRVETCPDDILTADTFLRRLDINLRTPDAIHLAVTRRLGVPLATFDERMAAAARTLRLVTAQV